MRAFLVSLFCSHLPLSLSGLTTSDSQHDDIALAPHTRRVFATGSPLGLLGPSESFYSQNNDGNSPIDPVLIQRPNHVSNNQTCTSARTAPGVFYYLDVTSFLAKHQHAWTRLPPPPYIDWWNKPYGGMVLSKDGSTIHFVSSSKIRSYNVMASLWGPSDNLTMNLEFRYRNNVVADVDTSRVYGFDTTWRLDQTCVPFSMFDPVSRITAKGNKAPE